MLIELEKGFVEADKGTGVNNENLDVIDKKIPEVSFHEFSKMLSVKTKKNIEDRDKTAEKNIKNLEDKSKGKIKYNF